MFARGIGRWHLIQAQGRLFNRGAARSGITQHRPQHGILDFGAARVEGQLLT
jgi:hypothetical protein